VNTVQRLERLGDHHRIEVGQGWISRDVEIDVRSQVSRKRQIAVRKGDEGDVAAVGETANRVGEKEIGEDVEPPLIGLPVREGRELKIGADTLVQQWRAVGDGNDGRRRNHPGVGTRQ